MTTTMTKMWIVIMLRIKIKVITIADYIKMYYLRIVHWRVYLIMSILT